MSNQSDGLAFDRRAAGCGMAFLVAAALLMLVALVLEVRGAEPAPMPQAAGPFTHGQCVDAALADARAYPLPANVRYLDARNIPAAPRRAAYSILSYHVNSLSRESKITQPRQVTPWLWAIDLGDYRWAPETWEKLADAEPYYSIRAKVRNDVVKTRQVVRYDGYGRGYYATEQYTEPGKEIVQTIVAPWVAGEIAPLVEMTGSVVPIVRADWFLFQTGAAADRKAGYYDWLGLGEKLADAEKLAALDRGKAIEVYREVAAIVPVSGVTPNNRQLFRFQTITGAWWESRDVKANAGQRNAVSNLLDDFKPDAFEVVFTLPNGLPAYYLADADGNRQDTAPDFIASDHRSTNNDRRVHVGYSCVACHVDGGLRTIRDYARRIYNPETGLALASIALDPQTARRLESVYLGPLDKAYGRDTGDFGEAIKLACGLTPAELSKGYEAFWSRYIDDPVTLDRAAAEVGLTPEDLQERIRVYAKVKGVVDPVIAVYLTNDPPPIRREHFEERFPLLMLIVQGVNP